MKMIDVHNLTFSYKKNSPIVINDLSFGIEQGTINVLLGLNGSGKTTLIKLIAGLLDNYMGDIRIIDKLLSELSYKERANIISYVSQKINGIDDFTVQDYLLFGKVNKISFYKSPDNKDYENVNTVAKRFNIQHLLEKKLGELSGGERQIVSICGALIQDTDIVILDEPTSALDIKNQHLVLSIIKEIANEQGKTFLLSSHNPNHALYLDSNVILLKNGEILKQGKAKELITIENLKPIYGEQLCYSDNLDYKEITFN